MLGQKVQLTLSRDLDLRWPWREFVGVLCAQITPEWRVVLQTVRCPTLFNHCQREYYVTPDGFVRVTLDFAQAAYDQRLVPRANVSRRSPLKDTIVIEIKAAQDQMTRLENVAAHFPVSRSRNSKYANGLSAALA